MSDLPMFKRKCDERIEALEAENAELKDTNSKLRFHNNGMLNEIAELRATVERLREELSDAACQYKCGCDHPSCNNCKRDTEYADALNKTPTQHLNDVKAEAVEELAGVDYMDVYTDTSPSQSVKTYLLQYAQQLREGE